MDGRAKALTHFPGDAGTWRSANILQQVRAVVRSCGKPSGRTPRACGHLASCSKRAMTFACMRITEFADMLNGAEPGRRASPRCKMLTCQRKRRRFPKGSEKSETRRGCRSCPQKGSDFAHWSGSGAMKRNVQSRFPDRLSMLPCRGLSRQSACWPELPLECGSLAASRWFPTKPRRDSCIRTAPHCRTSGGHD